MKKIAMLILVLSLISVCAYADDLVSRTLRVNPFKMSNLSTATKTEEVKEGKLVVTYTGVLKEETYTADGVDKLITVQEEIITKAQDEIKRLEALKEKING